MKRDKEFFRIFIATFLAAREIEVISRCYITELERKLGPSIRIVSVDKLHMTWKFLGDITTKRIERVSKSLRSEIKGIKPLTLEFSEVEIWPTNKSPQVVVWKGTDKRDNIKDAFTIIDKAMHNEGFNREKRPFKAHITLARFKKSSIIEEIKYNNIILEKITLNINDICIVKSTLQSRGPSYEILERIEL